MDWKIIVTTFITVFLAELGDKTQIITFGMAGTNPNKFSVFVGSALALITTSFLAVILGGILGNYVSEKNLQKFTAFIFFIMTIIYFWKGFIE